MYFRRNLLATLVVVVPQLVVSSFMTSHVSQHSPRLGFVACSAKSSPLSSSSSPKSDPVAQDALERTAAHLEKLRRQQRLRQSTPPLLTNDDEQQQQQQLNDPLSLERERRYREYIMQSANTLKGLLKSRELPQNGRKPDLAIRLVDWDMTEAYGYTGKELADTDKIMSLIDEDGELANHKDSAWMDMDTKAAWKRIDRFAGLKLSVAAGEALGRAGFVRPSPIQAAAIPVLAAGESRILHAETGTGKTLAYLLPITEQLWLSSSSSSSSSSRRSSQNDGFAVVMTPTRELAAQIAGIASVLAPPGTVRLVSRPTNLMSDGIKDRGQDIRSDGANPRLLIGSAKAIMHSLYGDGKMPASPTSKPEAMAFLQNVRYLVLDEVDRLLAVQKLHGHQPAKHVHEKPAAVVAAAVARLTLGKVQIVAASATVGRPLRRELARVLGLPPNECPALVRPNPDLAEDDDDDDDEMNNSYVNDSDDSDAVSEVGARRKKSGASSKSASGKSKSSKKDEEAAASSTRAVTIPDTVENYVVSVDGSSPGKLLTGAYNIIKRLGQKQQQPSPGRNDSPRILLVLTRGFGINTQNAIGALKHFGCQPEPRSLLDALEADGTDRLIEVHREVSGAAGVGQSTYFDNNKSESDGYLLVTGEDTVRGLHLDGLDFVLVVGRPNGPDEYTHIAGRTGRAGRSGKVINILSETEAASLISWERMLNIEFHRLALADIPSLL